MECGVKILFVFFLNLFVFLIFGCIGSSLRCVGFSLRWLLSLWSTGYRREGLSSCGARAQLLHGMWDLPGPGLEPVSPALAGRFLTTAPLGKPLFYFILFVLKPRCRQRFQVFQ